MVALFVLGLYVLSQIWHILLLIFVALIFSTLIDPFAVALQRRRIPRGVAALIIYVVLFGVIGFALSALVPVVAHDLPELFKNTREYVVTLKNHDVVQKIFGGALNIPTTTLFPSGAATGSLSGVFSSIGAVFGGLVSFIIVLVITFYLVIQDDPLRKVLHSIIPDEHLPFTLSVIAKVREKLGAWLRGQLVLSLIVGILIFLVLTILGVKYAAVIALLAGLFEFIPYVGPVLAAVPALFFAFLDGGVVKMIVVLVCLVVVQQFESHVLIPKIMQRAVGLNPIISIIALLTGVQLGGVIGGVMAIPVATSLQVVIEEVLARKKKISSV